MSITVERSDGGKVDAELIRPRSWILESGLCAGRMLPLNLPELEVSGLALVTAIDDCPLIAGGEGSVVTARFVTREVHVVASVDVLGADGTVETITGTTIHPVWSVDRQEWVPLAELAQGEGLCCDTESFGLGFPSSLSPKASGLVLSVSLSRVSQPVYNIEVHGEHVYQVGELGLLVHNTCTVIGRMDDLKAFDGIPAEIIDTWRKTGLGDNVTWNQNRDWLLYRWRRGDSFALATDPSKLPNIVNGFARGRADGYFTAREFDLLKKLGVEVIELWTK